MTSRARETTAHVEPVLEGRRTVAFRPPHFSFEFADRPDASQIAALGARYTVDGVRESLAKGNDEWIIARRGRDIVAAICVRAEEQWFVHTVEAPVVAAKHLQAGLERYLTHLAELWLESVRLPNSA